ncbi:SIMPL domain-containing protein [Pseudorhodobacter sp. MZDSW-24AT]|uniref:SIMPL domain-containing protein n=1 Tax=Pseudorhodobacter sp. MZDSW-24AT TaxID=2052957 RepID=UPI000C1EEC3A|nr:SIMPL domain-containing protein [Pseudorhodobacter sp. MZDSW-24AT]PJF07853.1 SIMPL domain-containing protein [Pseudorhodobacter sp. MZDSW-24AT]
MRILQAALIAALVSSTALTAAFAQSGPSVPQITVTGEGTVDGVPDIASLSLGVTTLGDSAAAAMAANTEALNAVMARLKAAGIADRDMQTTNLSINPNWTGYDNGARQRIDGYTASNQLTVRIRDLDGLGGVLDAAIQDGANTLNGLSFGLSEPRPALDAARKAAVEDARARATLLVEAAGATLGKIVSITEGGGYAAPQPMFRQSADAAGAVPVAAGEVATSASVTIVFEINQ